MTRLQQLAVQAFAKEPTDIVRKRVVWRFLDGIRDKEVRLHIVKERRVENDETAKSFAAVLRLAESSHSTKSATSATGQLKLPAVSGETAQVTAGRYDDRLPVAETPFAS